MAECLTTWICQKCSFVNRAAAECCERCSTAADVEENGAPESPQQDSRLSEWRCRNCTFDNNITITRCEVCLQPKNDELESTEFQAGTDALGNETRVIIIGRTGSGKSSVGNNILGEKTFDSRTSCGSVTQLCLRGKTMRYNRVVQVVDTPGLFDTGMENEKVTEEILKCVGISAPGPHAILLVVAMSRFTVEEDQTVQLLEKAFGTNMIKYVIVVFTRKDDLVRDGGDLKDVVAGAPPTLQRVLRNCQYRLLAFNNWADEEDNEQQVLQLFRLIDDMVAANNGHYYTSTIFEKAEEVIVDREREIFYEHRSEAQRRLQMVRRQLSDEYHSQMNTNEDTGRRYENELDEIRRQRQMLAQSLHWPGQQNSQIGEESDRQGSDAILRQKMEELECKINAVHKQQKVIKESTELTLRKTEKDVMRTLKEHSDPENVRDNVRAEVEQGSVTLIRRIWTRITAFGDQITGGFKHIFEFIKKKVTGK